MMNYPHSLSALMFMVLLLFTISPAMADIPRPDARLDHEACVKKGYILGRPEDPTTESYYNCRAEIAASHVIKPHLLGKLTPEEAANNTLMTNIARSFADKAQAAHEYRNSGAQRLVGTWEEQQSDSARKFDATDHKTCVSRGFNPSSWANPDTEQYYLCRAQLIEQRAPAMPSIGNSYEKKAPEAALYFYKKAQEAQYAFTAENYYTHHVCMDKGGIPGELDDPRTLQYYQCRAELAKENMGSKVVAKFQYQAAYAAEIIEYAKPCIDRGLKKGSDPYSHCIHAMARYSECVKTIPDKLAIQQQQDASDCKAQVLLQFPKNLSRTRKKKMRTVNSDHQVTTVTTHDSPVYSAKELKITRNKAYQLCLQEKNDNRVKYGEAALKLQCSNTSDTAPLP